MSGTGATFVYPVTDVEASAGPTPYQTVGPFFHHALPYAEGPNVAGRDRAGMITLSGRVFDGAGDPVPDCLVEVWQADEHGRFVDEPGIFEQVPPGGFRGFGRCATDPDGRYRFRTVKPGGVPIAPGQARAPHVAMSVFARGMLRRAVTRVYFDDETTPNSTDPLLGAVPPDRRSTLVAARDGAGYRFDVWLQGERETVFLDLHAG